MGEFIYFTDEQKRMANEVDLEELLLQHGEKLIPSGRDKRLSSDHSITVRGNEWFDHATGEGGLAIDFIKKYFRVSFPEAMQMLLGGSCGSALKKAEPREDDPKEFVLPPKNDNMRRVYAYLIQRRKINRDVLTFFAKEGTLYEDAEYHNAVFAGKDKHGVILHAHKRSVNSSGKSFRQNAEGSNPAYSFHHIGSSDCLYVFEAPIDMLSFITLNPDCWQEDSYVALCGVSGIAMHWMLEQNPSIRQVMLCLDNDKAGLLAAQRLSAELEAKGYHAELLLSEKKDWNEDLVQSEEDRLQERSEAYDMGFFC